MRVGLAGCGSAALVGGGERQGERERAALATLGFDRDLATHALNKLPCDGEAKPEALAAASGIGPVEAVEDLRQVRRIDAPAGVRDGDSRTVRVRRGVDGNVRGRWGVFDGVVHDGHQHLPDGLAIAHDLSLDIGTAFDDVVAAEGTCRAANLLDEWRQFEPQ